MTITKKLCTMAALAIFGVVLLAGVGTYEIERVDKAASYASVNSVPSILELDSVIDGVYSIRVAMWKYLANPTRAQQQEAEKMISASSAQIAKALDTYEKEDISDATDAEMIKDARKHIATYEASLGRVMTLAETDPVGARHAMMADQAIVDGMMSALKEHKKYNEKLGKAAAQTATTTKSRTTVTAVLICALTVVLIGLMLYLLLGRSTAYRAKP